MKCVICDHRPAVEGSGYCANCASQIEAEKRRRSQKPQQPQMYLTYRGHVVGLFPNGDGTLKAVLLTVAADRLPKKKTLDLNHYCDGYTRERVKRFKATVLRLAQA